MADKEQLASTIKALLWSVRLFVAKRELHASPHITDT